MESKHRLNIKSRYFSPFGNFIWAIIFILILAAVGRYLTSKDIVDIETKEIPKAIDWAEVDKKIIQSLNLARNQAEDYFVPEIDTLMNELIQKIDEQFLDWYFGYWNQQVLGIEGLWNSALHWWDEKYPTAAERITEKIQDKFSALVLRPEIIHRQVVNIADQSMKIYGSSLTNSLNEIQNQYDIKRQDWESHLEGISITIGDVEGNRSTRLSLKAFTFSSIGAGTKLGIAMKPMIKNIGSKVSSKIASKSAAKMATKTGSKVAAKAGGKFLGSIVGVGIIVWDLYDHKNTVKVQQPILRENLVDYIEIIKYNLLNEPETGFLSMLNKVEIAYIEAL